MEQIINILGIVTIILTTITYFIGGFFGNFLLYFSLAFTAVLFFSNPNLIIKIAFIYNILTLILHLLVLKII